CSGAVVASGAWLPGRSLEGPAFTWAAGGFVLSGGRTLVLVRFRRSLSRAALLGVAAAFELAVRLPAPPVTGQPMQTPLAGMALLALPALAVMALIAVV